MNDDTRITLADVAYAGFCRDGSTAHAAALGIDFHSCERGELTVGQLKAVNDPLADRIVEACHQRVTGQRAAAVRNEELIVKPSDLRSIGFCKEGADALLADVGMGWADVRQGKVTVKTLRAIGRPECEMLAVAVEARAARLEG